MQTSAKGRAFIRAQEGNPLTAYLDPVGVPTIGTGFTNRAPTATKMLAAIGVKGGKIRPGKTKITAAQSAKIFKAVLAADFEPSVRKGMPGAAQHEFDAGASGSYNLDTRFMNWNWAKLWRSGDVRAAAAYLADNYNTANGKKLAGLVRRRKEEAHLLLTREYTGVGDGVPREEQPAPDSSAGRVEGDPVVREAQEILTKRGFDPGAIDGWMGPNTKAAVLAYQKFHPHLVNDGILGPATLAQLRRDVKAAKDAAGKGASAVSGAGALAWIADLPWGWIALAVGAAAAGYFAWRYRDVIAARWNKLRGNTVEV